MKHLLAWLTNLSIDMWCKALLPSHHIALFPNGITLLSCILGKEHKTMCHFLLGLITYIPLPSEQAPSHVVRATPTLLNFMFLAQFPSHTTSALHHLDNSLLQFYSSKDVFLNVGIHSLLHYSPSVYLFSTTDNYTTEQMECLHIDLTKNMFCATNQKDEYYQMTPWNECHEKTPNHSAYIKWQQENHQAGPQTPTPDENAYTAVSFEDLSVKYITFDFQDYLTDFITRYQNGMIQSHWQVFP
ncbi:hypothetical protein V8E53_015343 [Lactarius tabidus]